jgi:hypothetical protein
MPQKNNGYILLLIAGALGILFNFIGEFIIPPTSFQLNPLTAVALVLSGLLVIFGGLIKWNKYAKIIPWISLAISVVLILSLYEWLPGLLGVLGSLLSRNK